MTFFDQINQMFGPYSTKLIGALAILIVGWLVAMIVSSLIGRALHRTTLDEKKLERLLEIKEPRLWKHIYGSPE